MTAADAGSNFNRNLQGHNYIGTDRLPSGSIRASESDRQTPILEEFGVNLTQMAQDSKLDRVGGRVKEIERAIDVTNLLVPALARGELQCIGATTLDNYRKYIERDAALGRRFQPVIVSEPSGNEQIEILHRRHERYEHHYPS